MSRFIFLSGPAVVFVGLFGAQTTFAQTAPPTPSVNFSIREPTRAAPAQCVVVQGVTQNTAFVRLRRTFIDNFDALQLSLQDGGPGWRTRFRHAAYDDWQARTLVGNDEQQIYTDPQYVETDFDLPPDNPFAIDNGILSITARRMPAVGPLTDYMDEEHIYNFTSGLLTTEGLFSQRYGYFEIRAKLPLTKGLWPAFWMLRADKREWPPEIDVIEVINRQPSRPVGEGINATHALLGGQTVDNGCYINVAGSDQRFRSYGVLWTVDKMTFYIDRVPVSVTATPPGMHDPMFLLLNLAVGPNADGTLNTGAMQVDWVAAYATY